jgi:hypothetical protein
MSSRDEPGTPSQPDDPETGEVRREDTPPPIRPEEAATPPHGDPLGGLAGPENDSPRSDS